MEYSQDKIKKYTQVYDYLKNIKFNEYITNRRDNIHNQLFNNAIKKLIVEVNNESTLCVSAQKIQNAISEYATIQEISEFNKTNFQFIEIKNKIWYMPSNVIVIYTHNAIKNENSNYIRLKIGPLSLEEIWDNEFLLKKNLNNVIKANEYSTYVIDYIDYVNGNVTIYDKVNFKYITIDLDYILNINNYEYSDNYNQLFTVKLNENNISD